MSRICALPEQNTARRGLPRHSELSHKDPSNIYLNLQLGDKPAPTKSKNSIEPSA